MDNSWGWLILFAPFILAVGVFVVTPIIKRRNKNGERRSRRNH